ncbi:MAG TPA: type VI secretion system tip protein TssI/VgrG [Sandaracinaceae bacterium LLY-WYZ-13_1]|nr:type VI secretion system tip protein TssI/VgrG [Sandaracinaceae bacterium LLY-WYZ-13_1]
MPDNTVRFSLETPLESSIVVTSVMVDEALDAPYAGTIRFEVSDPDADPELLLGRDVVLTWERDAYARRLCGLVRRICELGRGSEHTAFEISVVPAFALLDLSRNTRMFQEQSVPDILQAVLDELLGPYSREVQLDLTADYPVREYCLQYQERDLDFVHRLMQEEGISYSFDHEGEVEVLVLRDDNASYARVADAIDPVPYESQDLAVGEGEHLLSLERRHSSTVTAVTLRDFDWSTPGFLVEHEVDGEDARGKRRESYEHGWGRSATIWGYDAGALRYTERDVAQQKELRLQAHRSREVVGRGAGRVVGFVPGATFEVVGHPTVGVDGEYLITRVRHRDVPHPGAREAYHNTFECIPLQTPHRPERSASKPRVPSVQTAVVTGPSGEEIHTDEHGRIKVQFHWDRENAADERSSCWVRVQQKWAGNQWGFWWIPRIGMEVVVQFVDGDPDRPIVTGCVYNATNPPPYALPDEKTKSTIKSNSSPGGDGFNELRFEDAAGSEEIFAHAQKDYNEVVENDHTTSVGNDQTIQVDNDQTQTIHANQTEDVGANQSLTVDQNRTVHIEGDFDETVDGTESRTVSGDVTETFDANETRDIASNVTETIGVDETRTVGGSQSETVSGDHTVSITGDSTETVSASLDESVTGGITTETPASWTVTAVAGFNVTATAGFTLTATGGLNIAAPGGVQQVDFTMDWIGIHKGSNGILGRSLVVHKHENFGLQLALTAQKFGFSGVTIPSIGFDLLVGTDEDGKWGAETTVFGVDTVKHGADLEN